jgi:hypothetical protein
LAKFLYFFFRDTVFSNVLQLVAKSRTEVVDMVANLKKKFGSKIGETSYFVVFFVKEKFIKIFIKI